MWQNFNNFFKLLIWIFAFNAINCVPVKNPTALGNVTRIKDDLSTDFAKEIMQRAKAADIRASLNKQVQPCDDFYQFACGNWHRQNPAQLLNNVVTDKFQMLAKAFDRRLEQVLNTNELKDALENKVIDFYQACQVARSDEVLYKLELRNVYEEFGELPVLAGDAWNDTNFNWWQVIGKIQHKYGKQIILAVDIMSDVKNNTENKIYLGAPEFTMSQNMKLLDVLEEESIKKNLQQFFGVESELAKRTAREMIEFEAALTSGGTNESFNIALVDLLELRTIEELNASYSDILDVKIFLQLILGNEVPESIYVFDEQYLRNMAKLVSKTPKHIVANYILWQLLQQYLIDEDDDKLPKWCLERTKKYFGKYVDHMVYARYKSEEAERDIYEMWEEVRETFREHLRGDKLDWIANTTREYAIEKLNAMTLLINSYEKENFTAQYGNLSISAINYVNNVQQLLMLESRQMLKRLHEPASVLELTDVLSFTPVYQTLDNTIKIPVALLQPRYFWNNNVYPQALKYSSLAYLIAHEMVHGFDDDGRNYDKHGNLHSWWDKKSTYEFDARTKCFQAQYHNFKYAGKALPIDAPQSENIADNAGLKLAYAAYMRWLEKQKKTMPDIEQKEILPTLEFDNRQLFFINFAQVWCDDVQSLLKSYLALGDTHAPSKYRVIGSVSNFQEFSWVFKCKADAPMDPEFKCSIY